MKNQRNKNIVLLVITVFLLCCSIILSFTAHGPSSTLEDSDVFAVSDTSSIDQVLISSSVKDILLQRTTAGWTINEDFTAEPNIVRVLLAVIKDMEVVRSVPNAQTAELSGYLKDSGYKITISKGDEVVSQFYAAGNENKTLTYMMVTEEGAPKIVNIPGYDSYVAGIFEIPVNDWRDRTVLSSNWRTLKQMEITYAQFPDYNVKIRFSNNFLAIEGIENLDTAKMMNYIDQLDPLQADRFLDKKSNPVYDSLFGTPATVSMSVEDISQENSKTIDFYPLVEDDPMMLAYIEEDDQLVLFEAARIQGLFAIRSEFALKGD